jgi:hypothetical protein
MQSIGLDSALRRLETLENYMSGFKTVSKIIRFNADGESEVVIDTLKYILETNRRLVKKGVIFLDFDSYNVSLKGYRDLSILVGYNPNAVRPSYIKEEIIGYIYE